MASRDIPTGRIVWQGTDADLREDTIITLIVERNGEEDTTEMPLSRLIAMTNGDVIQYLP